MYVEGTGTTPTNRIIIAGSRTVPENCHILAGKIANILSNMEMSKTEIVSGGARGADRLGEYCSGLFHCGLSIFPADWDKYGKSAGYIRNKQMAEYATHLIAVWDGKSKGTKHMIDIAKEKGLKVKIIKI